METNQPKKRNKHGEHVDALKDIILKLGLDLDPDIVSEALQKTVEDMYQSGKTADDIAEALLRLLMIAKVDPEKMKALIAMRASKVEILDVFKQYDDFTKEAQNESNSG